jgi:hypothetical protein
MVLNKIRACYIAPVDVMYYEGMFLLVLSLKFENKVVVVTCNSFYNRGITIYFPENDFVFIISRGELNTEVELLTQLR